MESADSLNADVARTITLIDNRSRDYPSLLVQCVVLAEDRRYASHKGIDLRAIVRAATAYIARREVQGASTIEAQLFRTISNRREICLQRKLAEIYAAWRISTSRTKEQIIYAYLDYAYFGFEPYGAEFAANFLGYDIQRLSIGECCDLASRLKRPSSKPLHHPSNARLRQRALWLEDSIRRALQSDEKLERATL